MPPQKQPPLSIPKYYNVSETNYNFKESLEKNPAYSMVFKQYVEHPFATIGTWLGLGVALDAYSHACSGKYETSLLKKAANFGDSIQESKIIQSKPIQFILSGFKKIGNAGEKASKNSAIIRAMQNTPTMPEWGMVKTQMFNQRQEVVQDFIRIAEAMKLDSPECANISDLGLNRLEIQKLKKTFGVSKISEIPQETAVNQVILERLGKTPEQIKALQSAGTEAVKAEVLNEMGLTKDKLKLIKDDLFGKYIDDVMAATKKVKGRVKMGGGHYKWMGPFTKPFERTIGCDEIYNKLYSITKGGGAKTATGRFTAKLMQMVHRGLTFGGGKLGALIFIAPALVEVGLNTKKADKDQKVGTLANGLVENISWVFTFPVALKMLHSIGGIKYSGMTKEQVAEVKRLTDEFNERAGTGFTDRLKGMFGGFEPKECKFGSKTEYQIEKTKVLRKIEKLSEVKGQNIFTEGIRKLFGVLTFDLGNLKGYHGGNLSSKIYHDIPRFLKDAGGIPLRLVGWGLLSMGLLGGILTKCTTTVFGKSYDATKQEEHDEEKKKQKQFLKDDLQKRIIASAKEKQAAEAVNTAQIYKSPQNSSSIVSKGRNASNKNFIDEHKKTQVIETCNNDAEENENTDNYTYIPSQENVIPHLAKNSLDNYTYIPSSDCTIQSDKTNEKLRKYIPSQEAANIKKTFDNSGLESALAKAQRAEDKALRILAGNFENI